MPKVKFTKAVDERFGGLYRNPSFSAMANDVWLLSDKLVELLQRQHCGLPKDKDGKKQRDLIEIVDSKAMPPEGMKAKLELRPTPAVGGGE